MATKTRAELIAQALKNLGVLAAGQSPQVEDTAPIDDMLDGLMAEFKEREIVDVPVATIPLAYFNPLAAMVAYEGRASFGVSLEEEAKLKNANDEAIMKLKVMTRVKPTGEPVQTTWI